MVSDKALEAWANAWEKDVHTTDYALKRIRSAKSAKMTPIKIDANDLYGYFQGSHGRYETFLDYCPCGDFHRSKLPCKHIYRLAIELGLMDEEAEHNVYAIPTPHQERVSLTETIDLVESLSEDAQKMLLQIAGSTKTPQFNYNNDRHAIDELLESGLVVGEPEEGRIQWGLKKELIELLDSEKITYPPKTKRDELEKICEERIPQKAKERFGVNKWIFPEVSTVYSKRKIHHYLHRKLDFELFFDPESDEVEEIPLLQTDLPDDDVTNELVQRGYYPQE